MQGLIFTRFFFFLGGMVVGISVVFLASGLDDVLGVMGQVGKKPWFDVDDQVQCGNTLIFFFWLCVDDGIHRMWVSVLTRVGLTVFILFYGDVD